MSEPFHVVNIVTRGEVQATGYKILSEELVRIAESQDKRRENYTAKRLDLEGHLTFDALLDKGGKLVTFAGIYNGGRYPDGVFRVLNRVYVTPLYRAVHFGALASRYLLPHQLQIYLAEIKLMFVSREGKSAKLFLEKWCKTWAPLDQWKVSSHLWQVAPCWESSCFQYAAFRNTEALSWNPLQVTEAQWSSSTPLKSLCGSRSFDS